VGFKTVSLTVNDTAISTKTNYIDVRPEEYYMSNSALTVCNGTFYDSQGTSDYLNNEDYVMTFYPGDTNKAIQASFSTFSLEYQSTCSYDYLTIYNGPTTASPELGTWCGSNSPGTVVSSDPSGALTFEFHSDVSVVSSGWIASISCEDPPPPSYCTTGANTCDEYIERVQFAEIDNTSGCTTGGYHDYTSLLGVVSPGIAKTLTVTNGDLNWPSDQCGAWIDWNLDYVFDPATESISMTGSPGVGPYTASITAPTDAVAGPTRMRVRITYTGAVEPCGNTSYGEVEDYSVYIGTPGLWKGGTSGQETDWSVATNWDDHRVPTTSTNVHVPDNAGQYPELSGSVECLDLVIEDNATVKINPGTSIIIHGDLTIGPAGGGRLVIDSGSATVIGEITISSGSNIDIRSGGTLTENN
jgi:hypothetical protein